MENFSQAVDGGDVSVGGKLAQKYIDEVTRDCKDIKNDDKYNHFRINHTMGTLI